MGALHEPPPPYLVPEQMEQLVQDFAHDKKHILESVALFHLRFEGIHPFIDGNGRTGRLLLNLMLMQAGFPPINVKYADRERYYACFDSYHRDNDSSPMVEMLTKYAKERLFQMLQILQG
jgi:Fic family protein